MPQVPEGCAAYLAALLSWVTGRTITEEQAAACVTRDTRDGFVACLTGLAAIGIRALHRWQLPLNLLQIRAVEAEAAAAEAAAGDEAEVVQAAAAACAGAEAEAQPAANEQPMATRIKTPATPAMSAVTEQPPAPVAWPAVSLSPAPAAAMQLQPVSEPIAVPAGGRSLLLPSPATLVAALLGSLASASPAELVALEPLRAQVLPCPAGAAGAASSPQHGCHGQAAVQRCNGWAPPLLSRLRPRLTVRDSDNHVFKLLPVCLCLWRTLGWAHCTVPPPPPLFLDTFYALTRRPSPPWPRPPLTAGLATSSSLRLMSFRSCRQAAAVPQLSLLAPVLLTTVVLAQMRLPASALLPSAAPAPGPPLARVAPRCRHLPRTASTTAGWMCFQHSPAFHLAMG